MKISEKGHEDKAAFPKPNSQDRTLSYYLSVHVPLLLAS